MARAAKGLNNFLNKLVIIKVSNVSISYDVDEATGNTIPSEREIHYTGVFLEADQNFIYLGIDDKDNPEMAINLNSILYINSNEGLIKEFMRDVNIEHDDSSNGNLN